MRRDRRREETGAVAIMVALSLSLLLVCAAMTIDFGLVRLDRQDAQFAADNAVTAGLRAGDGGGDTLISQKAICGALQTLKANMPTVSGLSTTSTTGSLNCASPSAAICDASSQQTYTGSVTNGNLTVSVKIQNPYLVKPATNYRPEEDLSIRNGDTSSLSGCDQLGVVVDTQRQPGLGSIATSGKLTTGVRSAGRVKTGPGDVAPALLLLERTACSVLTVGAAGAGSGSHIYVLPNGTMPGSIHSDSLATASGCSSSSGSQVFQGKQNDGIVAFGTGSAAGNKPGMITSSALAGGTALNVVRDSLSYVFATSANTVTSPVGGTKSEVTQRSQVKRTSIDQRYLAGRRTASVSAYPLWNLDHSAPSAAVGPTAGAWTRYGCPSAAEMTTLGNISLTPVTAKVYIDCTSGSGLTVDGTIQAGTVYIHGAVSGGKLAMPNATNVYIDDTKDDGTRFKADALNLSGSNGFCIRATYANCVSLSAGTCSDLPTGSSTSKANLFIRRGSISSTGGILRMCNTTVLMGSGDKGNGTTSNPGACLPASNGIAPTATPCPASSNPCSGAAVSTGSSCVGLQGATDWTAPNACNGVSLTSPCTSAEQQAMWDAGEDLALWDETYGTSSDFKMAGGGTLHVAGVFMVPNANPFNISGGGVQDLTNAQFITRTFAVAGGATLTMKVDPNNAVPLPKLDKFIMIR